MQRQEDLCVRGHPGLHSEFQGSENAYVMGNKDTNLLIKHNSLALMLPALDRYYLWEVLIDTCCLMLASS